MSVLLLASPVSADIIEQRVVVHVGEPTLRVEVEATALLEETSDNFVLPRFLGAMEARVDDQPMVLSPHPTYPSYVVVGTVAEAIEAGTTVTFHITAEGNPSCGGGFGTVWCWHREDLTILPGSEAGRAWYLQNLSTLMDVFTGTIEVDAPRDLVVRAGQGAAREIREEGERTRWVFGYDRPTELLGVYAGRGTIMEGAGDFPFEVVFDPERDDPEKVARMADLGSELYPLLGEIFGVTPTDVGRVVLVPPNFGAGGMGLMGSPYISSYVAGELDYLLEQGVAHELGHSWWAGVASSTSAEQGTFMHEAFAEYSAWRALGELQGDHVRVAGNRMNAVWYLFGRPGGADTAIVSGDVEHPAYIHATYHKGSQVLRMLEERLGVARFTAALRGLLATGPGGLTVEALVEAIRLESGEDLTRVLDVWLGQTGHPRLTVDASDGMSISMEGEWDLMVPVRRTFSDGTSMTEAVVVRAGSQAVVIEGAPSLLEIDPSWTMVREVVPIREGDVTFDGVVDGSDLIEVTLRDGGFMPEERRRDGAYDPLYDINGDRRVDAADADRIVTLAGR